MFDLVGGGGGGGGGSYTQTPDTIRSLDAFEILIGLCAGPIQGPVHGLQSLKINGTQIEDASRDLNFKGCVALVANGDPLQFPQLVTFRLGAGAAPVGVGLAIGNLNVAGPGDWVTKTLPNTGADSVVVRLVIQQMFHQDNGGIFPTTMTLEIQMKPTGNTTWINPLINTPPIPGGTYNPDLGLISSLEGGGNAHLFVPGRNFNSAYTGWVSQPANGQLVLRDKTTSPVVQELRIAVPKAGAYAGVSWDVRIRLIEKDTVDPAAPNPGSNPVTERRTVSWESLSAVYNGTYGSDPAWRGVAWVQMSGQASNQITGIPVISGEYYTKICQVPPATVFDPLARTYTGATWDGSWASSYTNDPAWIIADAIGDPNFGIAAFSNGANLNKWDALEVSKWCSQQVPDGGGTGGTQTRYELNVVNDQPKPAAAFVQYMAGAVGALAWDTGGGNWRMVVDKPDTPVALFTLDNIEGEFLYAKTDVDGRFNDITMTFLNGAQDYIQDHVRVFNQADIDAKGHKPTTLVAIGCTRRQEALRRTMLRLRTSLNETTLVTFTTNRQAAYLQPNKTVLVADDDLGNASLRGRIVAVSAAGTQITLRDPIVLSAGVAYTASITLPNPNYAPEPTVQPTSTDWLKPTITTTLTITNSGAQLGSTTVLYLSAALPANTPALAPIALQATGLGTNPVQYRVLSVDPSDDHERVTIQALNIDVGKWAASDNVTETAINLQRSTATVPTPLSQGGSAFNVHTYNDANGPRNLLAYSWLRPDSRFITGYNVRYRFNKGAWTTVLSGGIDTAVDVPDVGPGTYDFEVVAVDRLGRLSAALAETDIVTDAQASALGVAAALQLQIATTAASAVVNTQALSDISNDNLLTPGEKSILLSKYQDILNEQAGIDAQATAYAANTEKTTYDNAVAALTTYLSGLTTPTLWSSLAGNTTIVGATFRATFAAAYTARQTLLNKVAAVAGTRANWSSVSNDNGLAPDNNATRNVSGGTYNSSTMYTRGTFVSNATNTATYLAKQDVPVGTLLTNTAYFDLFVNGGGGAAGQNAINGLLSNQAVVVSTAADGTGGTFTNAGGTFTLYDGFTNKNASGSCSWAIVGSPTWASINTATGVYTITDPGTDTAICKFDGSYGGTTVRLTYTIAKSKQGAIGAQGMAVSIQSSGNAFTFQDGVAAPSAQSLTLTAVRAPGTTGAATFSATGGVTLTQTGDTATISLAQFGTATQSAVTVTIGTVSDTVPIVRINQSSAEANATASDNMIVNAALANNAAGWGLVGPVALVGGGAGDPFPAYFQVQPGAGFSASANSGQPVLLGSATGLHLSGYTYSQATTTGAVNAIVYWFKADGTASATPQGLLSTLPPAGSGWRAWSGFLARPADAASFKFQMAGFLNNQGGDFGGIRIAPTQVGATFGATWGANLGNTPSNLAALGGNESINNDDLSLSAGGVLTRAGGVARGAVTIGGLGYTGALNATYGAQSGVNFKRANGVNWAEPDLDNNQQAWSVVQGRPANIAALTGSEPIQNTAVSIGSNGALAGGGGGQVTLPGIGFTGDTNATYGARSGSTFFRSTGAAWGETEFSNGALAFSQPSAGLLRFNNGTANTDVPSYVDFAAAGHANKSLANVDATASAKLASVEALATASDNLIFNGAIQTDSSGWGLVGPIARVGGAAGDPCPAFFQIGAGSGFSATPNNGARKPIEGAKKLYASGLAYGNGATAGTAYAIVYWFKADGSASSIRAGDYAPLLPTPPGWASWPPCVFTPPSDAALYSFQLAGTLTAGGLDLGGIRLAKTENGATLGAQAGTNLLDSGGATLGDAAIKNSVLAVSSPSAGLLRFYNGTANNDFANNIDFAGGGHANKSADYLPESATRKWAGQSGADVTASQTIVSRLASGTGRALVNFGLSSGFTPLALVGTGTALNGDAVSFGSLPGTPKVVFGPGGNAAPSGNNIAVQATGLSSSGFTMKASYQAVTAGATTTDTGAIAGGAGNPTLVISRTSSTVPYSGNYNYTFGVGVIKLAGGEPGSITVGFYAKQSGSWVQVAQQTYGASGTNTVSINASIDTATGIAAFGMQVISNDGGSGTRLSSFNSVSYTAGSTTDTSLTPAGASSIPWSAYL